ncbi:DUF6374 family protein [Nocardia takedensis]|uniref:DUF6374 family protein n=1 Tax=Nocardia takedensis TaxID=259390 RepID=UPI0014614E12|nr:DUF6374 family protein [Nocardia takedensis]
MRQDSTVSEFSRTSLALTQIDDVRRQLLDTAAFRKTITSDQLEHLAAKLARSLRVLAEEMR